MDRDKELDKSVTRQMILNSGRPVYSGGENWLGHGAQGGKNAEIDYLLLNGATMEQLLKLRSTEGAIRSHFASLKNRNGLHVIKDLDGKYRFDRQYLGISGRAEVARSPNRTNLQLFPEEIVRPEGLLEGSVCTISVNAYERNPKARKLCIAHYGPTCVVCGFNFETTYGPIAKAFIHVHHLKPLWEIGREYKVDPVQDLRPVCPNCHAVIHLNGDTKTVEEVKKLLGLASF